MAEKKEIYKFRKAYPFFMDISSWDRSLKMVSAKHGLKFNSLV